MNKQATIDREIEKGHCEDLLELMSSFSGTVDDIWSKYHEIIQRKETRFQKILRAHGLVGGSE